MDTDPRLANLYHSYNHGDPAAINLILTNVDIWSDRTFISNWYLVNRNETRFRFGNAPEQVYAESVDVDIVDPPPSPLSSCGSGGADMVVDMQLLMSVRSGFWLKREVWLFKSC